MPIPYTLEELRSATHELIAANELRECYIRPIAFRGYGQMGLYPLDAPVEVSIAVWPWGAYLGEEGKAQRQSAPRSSSWRRIPHDALIPHAKATGQYLNSVLAKIEASKAGYQEAILLDSHGFVCEGSGENIYVVRDGVDPHAAADRRDPRRDQPQVDHPDRPRPRLRGRRARPRPRRAVPRRRGVHDRHRRRARAGARDRRPHDRLRRARSGHPRAPARVRRRAPRPRPALRRVARRGRGPAEPQPAEAPPGRTPPTNSHDSHRALRHDPPRRDAGGGHVAVRAGEAAGGASPRRARDRRDRGRLPELEPQGARAVRPARGRVVPPRAGRRVRDDPPARHPRRRRSGAARARRVGRARVHDRRQDLGPAPREGREGRSRREPADDLGVGRVPGRRGQARDLRRRALLRRVRRRPGVRAPLRARGGRGGRRHGHVLRHERRHAPASDRRRGGGRRRGARADRRPHRDPLPRRLGVRRRVHAGRGASRARSTSRGR